MQVQCTMPILLNLLISPLIAILQPQGQICVAPDYVLCSPQLEAPLLTLLAKNLVTLLKNILIFSINPLG